MNSLDHDIEKYLSNEFSDEERNVFEQKHLNNPDVMSRIALYEKSIRTVRNSGLLDEMNVIHKKMDSQINVPSIFLKVAASILIAIFFYTIFSNSKELTADKIYSNNFTQYIAPQDRFRGNSNTIEEALINYNSGDYMVAIEKLADIEETLQTSFYLAISYMAINNHEKAIEIFESFPEECIYRQQVNWYLSLSYIKIGQMENALEFLNRIEVGDYNFDKSEQVKNDIQQLTY